MPDRIAQIVFLLPASAAFATHGCAKSHQDEHARQLATRVRTEFLHPWNNYERYAWGHDALRSLSKTVRRLEDVARCDQPDLVRQSDIKTIAIWPCAARRRLADSSTCSAFFLLARGKTSGLDRVILPLNAE